MRNLIERTRSLGLRVLRKGIVSVTRTRTATASILQRGNSTLRNLVQRTRSMGLRALPSGIVPIP